MRHVRRYSYQILTSELKAKKVCVKVRSHLYVALRTYVSYSHTFTILDTTFYDSVTGVPLFRAPVGRTFEQWKGESLVHGWPSFRDNEVSKVISIHTIQYTCITKNSKIFTSDYIHYLIIFNSSNLCMYICMYGMCYVMYVCMHVSMTFSLCMYVYYTGRLSGTMCAL